MRADSIYWYADVAAFFKAFFVISFLTVVYTSRIGKVAAVFAKMKQIWRNNSFSLKVKTRLYEAIILSTLLYSAEVWPLTTALMKRTNGVFLVLMSSFLLRCLLCKTDNTPCLRKNKQNFFVITMSNFHQI